MTTDSKPPLSEWPNFQKGDLICCDWYGRPSINSIWLILDPTKHNPVRVGNEWNVHLKKTMYFSFELSKEIKNLRICQTGFVVREGVIYSYKNNILTSYHGELAGKE